MTTPKEFHNQAMLLYEQSIALRFQKNESERLRLLNEAFELEKNAALLLIDRYDLEPTRGKLFASAATMAYQCQKFRDAEIMVAHGLSGNISDEILGELRDLFDKINFLRHLSLKGVELNNDELYFSIASGDEVMKGMINEGEFSPRISSIRTLYSRTIQRLNDKPYKLSGQNSESMRNASQIYLSTGIAASYAVTLKMTRPTYTLEISGFETPTKYIDEMLNCINLVNTGKLSQLRERINDDSYFQNFVDTTRNIAPDGDKVKGVGFVIQRDKQEIQYPLQRRKSEIYFEKPTLISTFNLFDENTSDIKSYISLTGTLVVANQPKNYIQLTESSNKKVKHKIFFTNEAQKDIVKKFYGEEVTIDARSNHKNELEFIDINNIEQSS